MLKIGVVAGEPSGDQLAAGLIQALKQRCGELQATGIAGPRMTAEGCEAWAPMDRLAVMGLTEIIARYPELKSLQRRTIEYFKRQRPDVFIGVDAPEFNLEVEEQLRAAGIRTVHYVSPSVWAWREGRLRRIRRGVDLMLTLFPFEAAYYRRHTLPVRYVGHPAADELAAVPARPQARASLGLPPPAPILALLPGSRGNEIRHHAKPFILTARLCAARLPALRIAVPLLDQGAEKRFREAVQRQAPELPVSFHQGRAREVLAAADAGLIASGTATLEAMLLDCPMVAAYRASWLSYAVIRPLIRISRFSLPNLLAGEEVVPEFIQGAVDPEIMADRLLELLRESAARRRQQEAFRRLRETLGRGASERAAQAVLDLIDAGAAPGATG